MFPPNAGQLSVIGNTLANDITISRDPGRQHSGEWPSRIGRGQHTVANAAEIEVFGQTGKDVITLDEANGAVRAALLLGSAGNDTLIGGSGSDQLFGGAGNDLLRRQGRQRPAVRRVGDDTLIGGTGDDQMFGKCGNDLMIRNPGEGTKPVKSGDGTDTAGVTGGSVAEVFTITANGSRVRFDRITPAPASQTEQR